MHLETESALYPVEPPNRSMYESEEGGLEMGAEKVDKAIKHEGRKVNCGCCMLEEKTYVLILFMVINMFLFADQNLLAPNLTVIAAEFGMTDNERDVYLGGYISLGFFAVGGLISMIVGYLADRLNRKLTFAVAVCVGEFSCFLTYWVPTGTLDDFWYGLWLTRAITGISIGGAVPIQFSIFGDYFSEDNRGKAIAFLQIAVGIGAGIGQGLAGFLSPDWRTPFIVVSVPAFILVALYVFTTKEPRRGQVEKALKTVDEDKEVEHTLSWDKFKSLFSRPTFLLVLLQGLPGILPWGIGQVFLNDFLIVEKNLTAAEAAIVIPIQGVGIGIATALAGVIADRLWKADRKRLIPIIAGISTILASFPMMAIVNAPPLGLTTYLLILPPVGFIAGMGGTFMKMILINVTLPETRGTAFAFQSLFDDLGRGIGPSLISVLIVSAGSRTAGIFIGYTGWIPSGLIMMCIFFTVYRDIEKNEAELKATRDRRLTMARLSGHYLNSTSDAKVEDESGAKEDLNVTSTSTATETSDDRKASL